MNKTKELTTIVKDLKKIYRTAMNENQLSIALQAQKAIAYVISKSETEEVSLNHFNKEQIEKLIKESEENGNKV